MDAAIPKNNEKKLIEMAEKLDEKELILLYNISDYKSAKTDYKTNIKLKKGLLIKEDKEVSKVPNSVEYVFAENPTRQMIESKKITHYFSIEDQKKADFIHHRNSGMNQVYAKFMSEQGKTYCFSYRLLLKSTRKDQLIGRFRQNQGLVKKYKIKNEIFSFAKEPYDLRAKHERQALHEIIR